MTVENTNVTVVIGNIANLRWTLKKGVALNEIGTVKIYRGNRLNSSAFLIGSHGSSDKLELFNKRLFVRFIGNPYEDLKVKYELNITNVKYGDKGMFYLRVLFGKDEWQTRVFRNATQILNVEGSFLLFCCFVVFILVL